MPNEVPRIALVSFLLVSVGETQAETTSYG